MLLPLLLIGVVAFIAGQVSKTRPPAIGALGPGAPGPQPGPLGAQASTMRPGERVRFELGVPYQIVVTTVLRQDQVQKVLRWLALGTYKAQQIQMRTTVEAPGSMCIPTTTICLCFSAPKTEVVPIGQRLNWDLGDGKLEVTLRSVRRLDDAPLTIGGSTIGTREGSRRLRELRAQAKAEMAMSRALGRPLGPIYARATRDAIALESRGLARPSEIPLFFDDLRTEIGDVPAELLER